MGYAGGGGSIKGYSQLRRGGGTTAGTVQVGQAIPSTDIPTIIILA